MGELTFELNDQTRWEIEPPHAGEISRRLLGQIPRCC
jgi:hypothetical protein